MQPIAALPMFATARMMNAKDARCWDVKVAASSANVANVATRSLLEASKHVWCVVNRGGLWMVIGELHRTTNFEQADALRTKKLWRAISATGFTHKPRVGLVI